MEIPEKSKKFKYFPIKIEKTIAETCMNRKSGFRMKLGHLACLWRVFEWKNEVLQGNLFHTPVENLLKLGTHILSTMLNLMALSEFAELC